MPLHHGESQTDKSDNAAMAMSLARRSRAEGGGVTAYHVGPIHSPVSGRTDHLPIHVVSGSYVLPADFVSGLGEGNTMAGFKVAKDVFCQSFYSQHKAGGGSPYISEGLPYGVSTPHSRGGAQGHEWDDGKLVPIIAAGGEVVIHPMDVVRIGHGSLDDGHATLDHVVKKGRQKLIKTLSGLPGPKKD